MGSILSLKLNLTLKARSGARGGGGGTPYVMGDTYVPRFWPPFFTLAGSSTIFWGYFSHPPTAKLSFGVQKLPIFTKIDLFGPKFNFFLDLFGSNFQRPAAHPHQFSGRVPPPPPGVWGQFWVWSYIWPWRQGQLPQKTIGILIKVFSFSGPNLVILAWTGDELLCG